jgi:hypothetical protein
LKKDQQAEDARTRSEETGKDTDKKIRGLREYDLVKLIVKDHPIVVGADRTPYALKDVQFPHDEESP